MIIELPNIEDFEYILLVDKSKLPKAQGIYFLWDKYYGIDYIGMTSNLRARISTHQAIKQNMHIYKISYLLVDDYEKLRFYEIAYMFHFFKKLRNRYPVLWNSPDPNPNMEDMKKELLKIVFD